MESLHFRETQKASKIILVFATVLLSIIIGFGVEREHVFSTPYYENLDFIVYAIVMLIAIVLFWITRIETTINSDFVSIQYLPFFKRKWFWSEITKAEIVDYGYIRGWGIRYSFTHGVVYNIKGKIGLAIRTKTGRKIVIGTQKSVELEQIIKTFRN